MAFRVVDEIPDGRDFSIERRDWQIVRRYVRTWKVITDNYLIGSLAVACAPGLPGFSDYYNTGTEVDTGAYVLRINPRQNSDNPTEWAVVVEYSSDTQTQIVGTNEGGTSGNPATGSGVVGNPLKRPTLISYSLRNRKKVIEQDFAYQNLLLAGKGNGINQIAAALNTGFPIANSAGEKFDPPLEDDAYNLVISILKNQPIYDAALAWRYAGVVASDAWFGFPAGAPRLIDWRGDPTEEQGQVFYQHKIEIECQYPDWTIGPLNQGGYGYGNVTGAKIENLGQSGIGLNGPLLLDAQGNTLVRTKSAAGIAAGAQVVTPVSMTSNGSTILVGMPLVIDGGTAASEVVTVTAVTATTFTATFINIHPAGFVIAGLPTYQTFQRRLLPFAPLRLP